MTHMTDVNEDIDKHVHTILTGYHMSHWYMHWMNSISVWTRWLPSFLILLFVWHLSEHYMCFHITIAKRVNSEHFEYVAIMVMFKIELEICEKIEYFWVHTRQMLHSLYRSGTCDSKILDIHLEIILTWV